MITATFLWRMVQPDPALTVAESSVAKLKTAQRHSANPVRALFLALLLAFGTAAIPGQSPSPTPTPGVGDETTSTAAGEGAKGVNPADNITKIELLPRLQVIDDDISIVATAIKYDRALNSNWGINVELPILRFQSPFGTDNGIGDVAFRFRYQTKPSKRVTLITGGEVIIPTATADSLGGGKLQLNPTVAAVYQVSNTTFVAGVTKQIFSVAGSDSRPDIRQSQNRLLIGYVSRKGWWAMADPQLWLDYRRNALPAFEPEFEVGKMVGPTTGIWFRAGGHVAGGWHRQDWNIGGGIRFISF